MITSPADGPLSADALLCDPEYLVNTDPAEVLALLPHATSAAARLAATVYRTSFKRHRRVDAVRRRQALSLDASRWGADDLARRIADVSVTSGDDVNVNWDTGRTPSNRLVRRLEGRTERVEALATATVDGRALVVGAKYINDTVRIWDMATGAEVRVLAQKATAVATTILNGRPILVAGYNKGLQRWDLASGAKIGEPLRSGDFSVVRITTALLDGRPIAIACGYMPDPVQVWDLEAGTRICGPLEGHTGLVEGADVAVVDGRAVLLTVGLDHTMRIWDLADGSPMGEPLAVHSLDVATTTLDGRPVAVTGGAAESALLVWDLATRTVVGEPLPGHGLHPTEIVATEADGRPIAVTVGHDRTVRLWDLAEGRQIGDVLNTHTESLTAVAVADIEGRPVAAAACKDNTVMLWDVSPEGPARPARPADEDLRAPWRVDWATGSGLSERAALSFPGDTCRSLAAGTVEGRAVVVAGGWNRTLRILDPLTGDQIGADLSGHKAAVNAIALTTVDGRAVAVTGDGDGIVRTWDLALGEQTGPPLTAPEREIRAVAVAELDGRPVALSGGRGGDANGEVRLWDLADGRESGAPLTGHGAEIHAIAVTELDGRPTALIASGNHPNDCTVRVWDLTTRRRFGDDLTGHTREIVQVATTMVDGRQMVVTTARDHTARVWDLATRTETHQLPIAGRGSHPLAIGEIDGRPVAIIGGTRRSHAEIQMWDLATGEPVGEPWRGHPGGPAAFAHVDLNGRPALVSGDDESIAVWDLSPASMDGSRPRPGVTGAFVGVAATEVDGREAVVTATGTHLLTWDAADGSPLGEPIRTGANSAFAVTELDGRPVAVTAPNQEIVVFDLADGSERARYETDHRSEIIAIAIGDHRDRTVVVTGTYDHAVSAHDLRTGKRVGRRRRSLHYAPVRAAAVTNKAADTAVITVGGDASAEIAVWRLSSGVAIGAPRLGDTDDVKAVEVTGLDGRTVAVTAGRDKVVRVWNVSDSTPVRPALAGHTGTINALATADLDGRPTAFSGADDRTVRVWDLTTDQPTPDELVFPDPVSALTVTPQGRLVVCFGTDIAILTRQT